MSAENFWDREVVVPTHTSWMEHPRVRDYILRSIARSEEGLWPVDWFMRWLGPRRFRRALSIGCGTGPFERDIARKNLVDRVDAFDGSMNSLRIANETAKREALSSIRYFAADFNAPVLPRATYDIVFIHQALHHVANLEKLLRTVLLALKPDAVLYLDEYIGPSRTDWTDRLIAPHRSVFEKLPAPSRRTSTLAFPIQSDDPSEAIRSSEIMGQVGVGFDVREIRGYGGNLLAVLYPAVDFDHAPDALESMIESEKRLLASGETPYYAVIVATPKRGLARQWALGRYLLTAAPRRVRTIAGRKLRAIGRRLARRRAKP